MSNSSAQPRILFVSPDVIFIPDGSEHTPRYMVNHSGGYADDLAGLIVDLYNLGVDVHVVQPDYRQIFAAAFRENQDKKAKKMPAERVHLTEDRAFFYSRYPDSSTDDQAWRNPVPWRSDSTTFFPAHRGYQNSMIRHIPYPAVPTAFLAYML